MELYIKIIIVYLIIINLVGYFSMLIDKKKAIKNKWRIKESTLLLFAALGGSIGSYFGMKNFRHKTKHLKFTLGIPFIITLQVILVVFIIYKGI